MTELDNTLLTSDPLGYFASRIGMIHSWANLARGEGQDDERADAADVPQASAVGRPDIAPILDAVMRNRDAEPMESMVVSAQVAVDAFALRHHVAEALTRLFVTCAERKVSKQPPSSSLWAQLTDDKRQMSELNASAVQAGADLGDTGFSTLVLPQDPNLVSQVGRERVDRSLHAAAAWVEHAIALLMPAELDVNSAHNKVKHGLAVRGRADLRLAFSTEGPDAEGNLPLSALADDVSFTIFESPMLEFMSRPRVRHGLEVTQLRLDYRALLAETAIMALVHGSLFNVAAQRHFDGREVPTGLTMAPHPGLFSHDTARPNLAGHQIGLRIPITTPLAGGEARPAWYGHRDGSGVTLLFSGEKISGQIVDDDAEDGKDKDDDGPDATPPEGS